MTESNGCCAQTERCRKYRYDLVSLEAMDRYAMAMGEGAKKYGEREHLENPQPEEYWLSHAVRHIYLHLAGEISQDHLGHAMADIGIAIQTGLRKEPGAPNKQFIQHWPPLGPKKSEYNG